MQAVKCGLDLNRNDLDDSLNFDMNLKTNPIGMIQMIKQNCLDFCKIDFYLENNVAIKRLFG